MAWLPIIAVSCAANIFSQVSFVRAYSATGIYLSMLFGSLVGAIVLLALSKALGESAGSLLANLLIYCCFSYVYFHWNNMGETARRVRIVIELATAPMGLSREELLVRYNGKEVLDRRIVRLQRSKQVIVKEGIVFSNAGSFYAMSLTVNLLKMVLGAKSYRWS